MKMYRFPENRIWKVIFAAFLFLMLLLARDTLVTSSILGFYKSMFYMYSMIGLMGIAFLVHNRKELKKIVLDRRMLVVLVSTVVYLVPMVVKQDWQLMYFSILLCIYFAVFLSCFLTLEEVSKIYIAIIAFLGVYSWIASYLLEALVEAGVFEVPQFSNTRLNFYNFGFAFSPILPYPYYRNYGIFREPGVYQYFIILALYLNNYTVSWNKNKVAWIMNGILVITMLTTFATGGFVELGLFAVILFVERKLYKNKRIRLCLLICGIGCLLFAVYSVLSQNVLYTAIKEMVMRVSNTSPESSGSVRLGSIIVDLMIFLQHPLFGERLAEVMYAEGLVFNTTSTMITFAAYGIFAGIFHTITWIALVWQKNRKTWVNLGLLLVLFMSFNTQDLTADAFFWLFPVMALVEKGLPLFGCAKEGKRV